MDMLKIHHCLLYPKVWYYVISEVDGKLVQCEHKKHWARGYNMLFDTLLFLLNNSLSLDKRERVNGRNLRVDSSHLVDTT